MNIADVFIPVLVVILAVVVVAVLYLVVTGLKDRSNQDE